MQYYDIHLEAASTKLITTAVESQAFFTNDNPLAKIGADPARIVRKFSRDLPNLIDPRMQIYRHRRNLYATLIVRI
ncbi:hypothetical protein Plhal304r1_c009g0034411 [Plasmopara halstedii]